MNNNNTNLPTVVNNNIFEKIKKSLSKTGKFAGYTIATGGLIIGGVVFPIVAVPALVGAYFTGQKALNNSLYKEYKDLAFITKKIGNKVTIAQDSTKIGVLKELRDLSDIEKYGFMQLQTIIGISKFEKNDKKRKGITI